MGGELYLVAVTLWAAVDPPLLYYSYHIIVLHDSIWFPVVLL